MKYWYWGIKKRIKARVYGVLNDEDLMDMMKLAGAIFGLIALIVGMAYLMKG